MRVVLLVALAGLAAFAAPGPEQIPAWARQGNFRFARLDGGPIEIQKTARSEWGKHFNDSEKDVLGNLYTKYADQMIERLQQARVNWVWITWSVGYSWADEERQREQARVMIQKLHAKGIRVSAYVCATTVFWESMFRDEPRSVRWIALDKQGVPFRYSGGRDAMRFIADVSNPEWVDYVKRRVGSAIDAGVDGFFIDNTSSPLWSTSASMERFLTELRRYVREEKKSPALLMSNFGLSAERAPLNRTMDVTFNEYWREPGVWGDEWDVSNVRRMRYVQGLSEDWKPMMSEYSNFHEGNRSTMVVPARSARLGIAEAAAFGSSYTWNMEGPFYERLLRGERGAADTWREIAAYNAFLADHSDLYRGAKSAAKVLVLLSGSRFGFAWDRDETGIADSLSKRSVVYDARLARTVTPADRVRYAVVVETAADAANVQPTVAIEGAQHVLANVTEVNGAPVVHVLNYNPHPVSGVRLLRVRGGRMITPDAATCGSFRGDEFVFDTLDTYAVISLKAQRQ